MLACMHAFIHSYIDDIDTYISMKDNAVQCASVQHKQYNPMQYNKTYTYTNLRAYGKFAHIRIHTHTTAHVHIIQAYIQT